jgi:hypothetical protein
VALCQARISTKPLWGFSSSNPYHSQSRAEQVQYFLYEADGFTFLGFLADAKTKIKILLTSMEKKLTNSEDCTESSRRILFWLSSFCHWSIFSCAHCFV